MKTKQVKEEPDRGQDDEITIEPKTRARKKAENANEEDKNKPAQEEPRTSKDKRNATKPKALVKKRPLGIRKTLRNKKVVAAKHKLKQVIKKTVGRRGRKPAIKVEPDNSQEKEAVPLIPASEIKKEPVEEPTSNSRSSSPKTAGRRPRLSSDMLMMKSVLGDSSSSLVLGSRTSPYSMRSERSNSPSLFEGKNLRSGKPRKVKSNLLNEVVMKEQKKRRRLLSDSKTGDTAESTEDCKKLKRGRSCSRDGSEISKCSDVTESDMSVNETLNETDSKELIKKLDKPKTDLDVEIENNLQISTLEQVPSLKQNVESSCINDKNKKKLSLKRSTSLDSDNNNSNRLKLENLNSSDSKDKLLKMENDTLFDARSSILTSMSKTFNSKEMSKNIRKARKGRKAAAAGKPATTQATKNGINSTITNDMTEDKLETIDTLANEISELINNLDQTIDQDNETDKVSSVVENTTDQLPSKQVSKFYGLSKPLGDNNSIVTPETPVKTKDIPPMVAEVTPSKNDDSENIRLHYEEDPSEKSAEGGKQEIPYSTVASIDKLMDRLKEFEEFDKRRQRQESESKSDGKQVMVTNDVVLIPKSGDIKPLKDIQSVRSPEKPIEKENVLSCFENNSAISIVKRDQVRRSVELPDSVTLIKRNSVSARKESTSSNHSREADAISIFEKTLGKDVTLTEIRKSVDKSAPTPQVDLHQLATLHPNNPNASLAGVVIDSNQISITPRVIDTKAIVDVTKNKVTETKSRKSAEFTAPAETEEKMATIEKIKSPPQDKSSVVPVASTPVAVKSLEATLPIEAEASAPPLETIKSIPEDISLTYEVSKADIIDVANTILDEVEKMETAIDETPVTEDKKEVEEKMDVDKKPEVETTAAEEPKELIETKPTEIVEKIEPPNESKLSETAEVAKPGKSPGKGTKSARNSIESQPGPSNVLFETPESQKRKESVLRTLGLLTHKEAKEAELEQIKEKERIYNSMISKKSGKSSSGDYTGTLKTVIKLNRSSGDRDKKKYRSPLKITFQKSKNRSGKPTPEAGDADGDEAYYTIERREVGAAASTEGGQRKSHYSNRYNNHEIEAVPEPAEPNKDTVNLVIPEKASSFSIHPGRLCKDQCSYCGGKFGLFDTPCHIASIKSTERQKRVLDNEEKLTVDSCLCDACYRHVDRRANCPSYRKRVRQPPPPGALQPAHAQPPAPPRQDSGQGEAARSPPADEAESGDSSPEPAGAGVAGVVGVGAGAGAGGGSRALGTCHTEGCAARADHAIRRKWLIKVRSSVSKVLKLEYDYPGMHTIPLCAEHYRALAPLMACVLCRRRITKHHNVHVINQGYLELNPLLAAARLPVQFSERPVLCKLCRNFCSALARAAPPAPDAPPGAPAPPAPLDRRHSDQYRRKLLQIYNVEVPEESENETEEPSVQEDSASNTSSSSKQKKKARTKTKQRKSTEPEKPGDNTFERTTESPLGNEKPEEHNEVTPMVQVQIEEDIESLISSNKIPVPGANKPPSELPSDGSETEAMLDTEAPVIPIDKQTALQYLLQQQNNPAQYMSKPNLTQKHRHILKLQNVSGVQKSGMQHRIHDKNAKRLHKLGHMIMQKDKTRKDSDTDVFDLEKAKDPTVLMKNIPLNDECTIETISNKKPADINTLKNKWQMSDSFTQVKKNLSELSKNKEVPKKPADTKYTNPVKRLETNPSISVRELFPGEEEMNLQCNIEFNNVKGVTPAGWEKCNTTIQYDSETKRLWTELQRPYGNQSSFLRHLILLEKYFRNGDLVLSHGANPNACNYSDSVQSRLRAYDNVVNDTPRRGEPAISLIEFRKKPSLNGKSLLKNNLNAADAGDADSKKSMPPPGMPPKPKSAKTEKSKNKALPPELIAINTPNAQGRKSIQNVLHNIQQLVKGVSASDPIEVASGPLPVSKPEPVKEKKDTPKPEVAKKKKTTSKPWRPTLMPMSPENIAKMHREPHQIAIDGRLLPCLVKVMSSNEPYYITRDDYNKLCVMRRDKLQQLHDSEAGARRPPADCGAAPAAPAAPTAPTAPTAPDQPGAAPPQAAPADRDAPDADATAANAATILKNVGLKNITIAPIPPKTATVTSQTVASAVVSSPSLLVTTPMRLPQVTAVSVAGETVLAPNLPTACSAPLVMPKIPRSLTVIPQTMVTASAGGAAGAGPTPPPPTRAVIRAVDGPRP